MTVKTSNKFKDLVGSILQAQKLDDSESQERFTLQLGEELDRLVPSGASSSSGNNGGVGGTFNGAGLSLPGQGATKDGPALAPILPTENVGVGSALYFTAGSVGAATAADMAKLMDAVCVGIQNVGGLKRALWRSTGENIAVKLESGQTSLTSGAKLYLSAGTAGTLTADASEDSAIFHQEVAKFIRYAVDGNSNPQYTLGIVNLHISPAASLPTDADSAGGGSGGGGGGGGTGGGQVNSVVAGTGINVDSTDPANPVVSAKTGTTAGTVCAGDDSRLSNARTPTGSASGDLGGTYPSPTVLKLNGDSLPTNAANGFLKRNSGNTAFEEVAYGIGANTVCQGNDSRLSDSRAPSGSAGGDLSGTFPNPTVSKANGNTFPSGISQGDLLYGSASNTISKLPKNTTAGYYLSNQGASFNPLWAPIATIGAIDVRYNRVTSAHIRPESTTIDSYGYGTPLTFGTLANNDLSDYPFCKFTSSASAGSIAGFRSQYATLGFQMSWRFTYVTVIHTDSSIANIWLWAGIGTSGIRTTDPTTEQMCMFRYSPTDAAGNGNWRAYSSNGSGSDATDTGVAVAIDTTYVLQIDHIPGVSDTFYINGVLVATNTSHVSAGNSTVSNWIIRAIADTAAAKSLNISRVSVYH